MKKCKNCGSEYVCWNWMLIPMKCRIYVKWLHECFECGGTFTTHFKVRFNMISDEELQKFDKPFYK